MATSMKMCCQIVVMKDIDNSEMFVEFGKDGGENIAWEFVPQKVRS